ncbi:hypothetical protein BBK36DRAFT_1172810 [Trichoderma citrinoviride]|uniref:Isopenicillin N synthase-like Fe(2+) 2OG dioxygenase domain-containing protein n=1 Tax=Trichoderma citrinoviride TaxID=58853 RepID=A0A2T4AYW3_9HYPO|nr:hypothetical protein BBK36DRAFT_1172810 [Trichoderma citrinoviride]PTB62254.1 hypothetical protein BBK36DRAFT_1172810 [Trichoderma citrinoviride]
MALEVIDYQRLLERDDNEIKRLVSICSTAGLFFLDLRGQESESLLADLQPIIDAQRNFFGQKPEMKMPYASPLDGRGYDSFDDIFVQRLKLSREEQVQGCLALPKDLQAVEAKVSNVSSRIDAILRHLSMLLCQNLDPPVATKVVDDPNSTGLSNLCLGISAAKAGTPVMGEHLDEDLLTLTFYDEPFLEVLDRQTQTWKLVDVLEHLPIVNVGDRFQGFSDGRLHAPLHRVKQTPNEIDLIMYDLDASVQQVC